MATYYGNQYQDAFVNIPSNRIRPGDISGEVKVMFFDFTVPAVAPIANDVFKLAKIPKGARVLEACLMFPDLGTTGLVSLGYAASADAVEAADSTAFISSQDVFTAADTILASQQQANPTGVMKLFSAEVDLELKVNTAWTAVAGTVKGYLLYRTI